MKRNVDLNEISDGRFYELNDMVKADCSDCKGCSACCHGMGTSIVLDPLDVYRLSHRLSMSFEELLHNYLELHIVDSIILPNLRMVETDEHCAFLNQEGRCSIHDSRPGICRIFPLGRIYENNSFRYFLQTHECKNQNRAKVKVKKWIDTPNAVRYDKYIADWHYFLAALQAEIAKETDETRTKQLCMMVLQKFYLELYEEKRDFFEQVEERMHLLSTFFLSDYHEKGTGNEDSI